MAGISAAQSGTFKIGGDIQINRLGFGAMRITGPGIWGEPADRPEALRTLRRLPELDVDFIDTSDAYGPDVSEELIHEALHPYGTMLMATKGGLTRTGPDVWVPLGRPEYFIQEAYRSRRHLGVDTIGLWQLDRIDPKVPRGSTLYPLRDNTTLSWEAFCFHLAPHRQGVSRPFFPTGVKPWQPTIQRTRFRSEYIEALTTQDIANQFSTITRLPDNLPN